MSYPKTVSTNWKRLRTPHLGIKTKVRRGLAILCAIPFLVIAKLTRFIYVSQLISLAPFRFGEQVRYEFYRRTLARCGENVTFNFGTILSYPDITIGSHVWLGTYNIIGHVDIGDYTLTAQGCHLVSGRHGHPFDEIDTPIILQPSSPGRIHVGPDIWLGAGVVALANIGQGCVVGAGSIVAGDLPDWAIAVGNPARVIRYRKEVRDANLGSR